MHAESGLLSQVNPRSGSIQEHWAGKDPCAPPASQCLYVNTPSTPKHLKYVQMKHEK